MKMVQRVCYGHHKLRQEMKISLKLEIYGDKGGLEWEQENPNYLKVDILERQKKLSEELEMKLLK